MIAILLFPFVICIFFNSFNNFYIVYNNGFYIVVLFECYTLSRVISGQMDDYINLINKIINKYLSQDVPHLRDVFTTEILKAYRTSLPRNI